MPENAYRFEKLRVYQNAMLLVKEIYNLIKILPGDEKYCLSDQLRRSSISIVLNIAEGTGSLGDTEFKSFLRNALKSLYETVAGLKVAEMLYQIKIGVATNQCGIVGRELNALINSLKTNS